MNKINFNKLKSDGGMFAIFRKFAVIGDSLSAGEFELHQSNGNICYKDFQQDYSWGKFLARASGSEAQIFAQGGFTAEAWLAASKDCGYFDKDKLCQCYIIALGINDLFYQKKPVGTIDDVDLTNYENNKNTFAGNLGKIVLKYKELQPDAKFFFITMAKHDKDYSWESVAEQQAQIMREFARFFDNSYVIDLRKDGPCFDAEFRKKYFYGGHMNALGYRLFSKIVGTYIDNIIESNPIDFCKVGYIGIESLKETKDV